MSPLAALMGREIAEAARKARALAEPALWRASLALVAALLAAAGVGFLLSAVFLTLARHLGPAGAGLFLGVALSTCATVLFLDTRRKRPGQEPTAALADQSPTRSAEGKLAPLAAFVAAFAIVRQLRRRQTRRPQRFPRSHEHSREVLTP